MLTRLPENLKNSELTISDKFAPLIFDSGMNLTTFTIRFFTML